MKKSSIVLWILIGLFFYIAMGQQIARQLFLDLFSGPFGIVLFWLPYILFFVLGVALVIFTLKEKVEGKLKKFLMLAGIAPAAMFVSIILHNVVYGLFIVWFGDNFWDRVGLGDEPVFFLIAVIVCPIAFLIGIAGSAVLLIKRKNKA